MKLKASIRNENKGKYYTHYQVESGMRLYLIIFSQDNDVINILLPFVS